MKVVFDYQVFSSQIRGGVSNYFVELIKGFHNKDIELIFPFNLTITKTLLEWNSRDFIDLNKYLPNKGKGQITTFLNSLTAKKNLRRRSFDLLHPTYYNPYFLNCIKNKPFVITVHDMTHELFPSLLSDYKIVQKNKRLLVKLAEHIIVPSENTKKDLCDILGTNKEKISVINHGTSLNTTETQQPKLDILQNFWLYVGDRSGYKNSRILFEAFAERNVTNEYLVFVGGGKFNITEIEYINKNNLNYRCFQISPNIKELAWLYQKAKALIYPSHYEGFGFPLIEAMSCGCPVIASNASCLPEIGGDSAFYFDPNSVSDLLSSMKFFDNEKNCSIYSEKGYLRAKKFTWDSAVDKTLKVYNDIIK